ncbi:MAG: N,N'-diacetylchitobiose phosphorylase, partial [Spirochaetaceae bacterium]|nr:N,N'-diacetylchitobiose phosphorylase [Spirochaetaceae bacterium]
MRYGYFDNENREYVIEKIDLPCSWTNYIGVKDMAGVFNHTAGGYVWYKSPEHHRITRFRGNAIPADRPGHYVYLRDDDTGEYWSLTYQPAPAGTAGAGALRATPLRAPYSARFGLSYNRYFCNYSDINATQTLFIPKDDPVELWDVVLKNES